MTSNEFELLFKEYWTDTASGLVITLEAITKIIVKLIMQTLINSGK
ncbi:hypothetical protein VQ643_16125 [Pseudomonas sp. F1_0610]